MPCILTCIDTSTYAESVCDHAAWMAGRIEASVEVLHATETDPAATGSSPEGLVADAVRRLQEQGAENAHGRTASGDFVTTAVRCGGDLIVMGKRGASNADDRGRLGSNVHKMLRATDTPVCLTSRVFLPIARVLVVLDADLRHRRAVEFVAGHAGLQQLEIDLVVGARSGEDPSAKLEWARCELAARDAEIFAIDADGPDEIAERYMEGHGADLVVVSRQVLAPDANDRLARIEERGLWGWRTPVLVC